MKPASFFEMLDKAAILVTGAAAALAFGGGFLGCIAVLGWQCVKYLKVGEWPSLSAVDVALRIAPDASAGWLLYPDKWLGVHKIMQALPASITLWIAGIALGMAAFRAHETLKK